MPNKLRTNNDDITDNDDDSDIEHFKIFKESINTHYKIYMSDEIHEDSEVYIDLIHTLNKAETGDTINLHLSNFGGAAHSGFDIGYAIRNSKAIVNIIAGACYSMGAILALSGDSLTMRPAAMLMFHNYSGMYVGKGQEIEEGVVNYKKHFKKSIEYFCSPYLTSNEINRIMNDRDVYIHDDDEHIEDRLNRHFNK